MGVGGLTVFDEFRAPAPPNPGVREFAIVATRARVIRRRRRAWTASGALAVTGLLAVTAVLVDRPGELATSTDDVPTTVVETTVKEYALDELASIDQLPVLDPGGRTLPFVTERQQGGEVFARPDGSVCVRDVNGTESDSCASVGARLHVVLWDGVGGPGQLPLTIFLIDADVSVAIKAAENECRVVLSGAPIDVRACTNLDPATTSVRVIDAQRVLIDTVSSG
jgi:hypothetical protein